MSAARVAAALAALSIAPALGCESDGHGGPSSGASDAAPPPLRDPGASAVTALCGAPRTLAAVRRALPGRRFCDGDEPVFVRVPAGDRAVLVVASPRPDGGALASGLLADPDRGALDIDVVVGGKPAGSGASAVRAALAAAGPPAPADAAAAVEAALLATGHRFHLTGDGLAPELAGWPEASALVNAARPGLAPGPPVRARAWASWTGEGPTTHCRMLALREVTIAGDGRVRTTRRLVFGRGSRGGEPCGLPVPGDARATDCPAGPAAPPALSREVERLVRAVAGHASWSAACYGGPGGEQAVVRDVETSAWRRGPRRVDLHVRYRMDVRARCGGDRACRDRKQVLEGCARVPFARREDARYALAVDQLVGLRSLVRTPLSELHDGECGGLDPPFHATPVAPVAGRR